MNADQNELTEVERRLGRMTPRPAPADLRHSVLAAVASELSELSELAVSRRPRRWDRRLALAATVLLVAGVLLNVIVNRSGETRLAKLLERDATPAAIDRYAAFIEPVTDRATARRIEKQLVAMTSMRRAQPDRDEHLQQVQRILNEWALTGGDWLNAQNLEVPQMDRHRAGDIYRGALDHRRHAQLARELTA